MMTPLFLSLGIIYLNLSSVVVFVILYGWIVKVVLLIMFLFNPLLIQKFFKESYDIKEQYMIQCWLNFYRKGEFIDWHRHWPMDAKGYHGFLCVSCEPSKTTYRLPAKHGVQIPTELIEKTEWETVDVESKNGLLVLSESAGDMHRTWPWEFHDRDRITIAFDIVPKPHFNPEAWLNHWVPL